MTTTVNTTGRPIFRVEGVEYTDAREALAAFDGHLDAIENPALAVKRPGSGRFMRATWMTLDDAIKAEAKREAAAADAARLEAVNAAIRERADEIAALVAKIEAAPAAADEDAADAETAVLAAADAILDEALEAHADGALFPAPMAPAGLGRIVRPGEQAGFWDATQDTLGDF